MWIVDDFGFWRTIEKLMVNLETLERRIYIEVSLDNNCKLMITIWWFASVETHGLMWSQL